MPNAKPQQRSCKRCSTEFKVSTTHKYYCSTKCRTEQRIVLSYVSHIKLKYGLSYEQFTTLLSLQNHECKICNVKIANGLNCHVDHCHTTNKIRGLLCSSCNQALGLFKDNTLNLKKAIKYLEDN
jgi:hypothetical protein